jgi:hypothetical protein
MAELHDRMPAILGEAYWGKRLWRRATNEQLLDFLTACPDEWLKVWPADNKVATIKYRTAKFGLVVYIRFWRRFIEFQRKGSHSIPPSLRISEV